MALLKEATNEQARAKVGAFGRQGSGKTTTLALLAIGCSINFHKGAPVAMLDTENGSDFIEPIFRLEGIRFFPGKSGAFADMVPALREAKEMGCCAFIMDSVTHTWTELKRTYAKAMAKKYNIPSYDIQFQDWEDLKGQWGIWTQAFLNSPLHCFIAGRAGNEYEYEVNEKGKKVLVKGDSKMKTEGEFGYEPNLLIEMESERRKVSKRHTGGSFIHFAHVLKDRARFLNGKSFEFPDINEYKKGDWKKVWDVFAPHFSFLNIEGTQRAIATTTSEDLFPSGDTEYRARTREKQIALDEILATMQLLFPGQSAAEKAIRIRVMETIWSVRAWTAVEAMPLEEVQRGLEALRRFERDSKTAEAQETESGILDLLKASLGQKDGTLHIVKETAGLNLPPIPPSQNLPLHDEELEEIAISRRNGSLVLAGSGTFRMKATLKNVYGGEFDRVRKVWTIEAKYETGFKEVCTSLGISVVEAASVGA